MNTTNQRNYCRRQVEDEIAVKESYVRINTNAIYNLQNNEQPFSTETLVVKKRQTICQLEGEIAALQVKLQDIEAGKYDAELTSEAERVKEEIDQKTKKTAARKSKAASTNMMKGTKKYTKDKKKSAPKKEEVVAATVEWDAVERATTAPARKLTEKEKDARWGPAGGELRTADHWTSFTKKEPVAAPVAGANTWGPRDNKTPYQRFAEKAASMNDRLIGDLKNMHDNEGRIFKGITFYGFLPSKRNFTLVEESLREGGYQTHHTFEKNGEKVYEIWKGRRFKRGQIISVRRAKIIDTGLKNFLLE